MAKMNVAFGRLMHRGGEPDAGAVFRTDDLTTEDLTPGAANSVSVGAVPRVGMAVRLATDTTCYVAFGVTPDATVAGSRILLLANTVTVFEIPKSHKVACAT